MRLTEPSMASEDFSHYLHKVPGCFFFVGNGDQGPIHSAQYNFNDDIIPIAAEVMGRVAMNYLNKK
jgi:metal-dependent amidase/aminoacylase/carboxypeptidase family protein